MTRPTRMRDTTQRRQPAAPGIRRRTRAITTGALILALVAGGTTAASAAEVTNAPGVVRQSATYKVVNIHRSYHVKGTQEIGRCGTGTNHTTCSIHRTRSATRTIQTSFGLSRGTIAAGLDITSARSVQVGTTCSHRINANQVLVGYPMGTKYRYRIKKVVRTFSGISTHKHTSYSSYRTAFSPSSASLYCIVKHK